MKTIKELEAESKIYMKLQRHEDEEPYIICETKIKALKNVLKLIDKCKRASILEHPEFCKGLPDFIDAKELKSKIKGKEGK